MTASPSDRGTTGAAAPDGPAAVDAYIAGFPPEVQETLTRIRRLVHDADPAVTEAIKYGMPAMVIDGRHTIYFAGWTKHVAVYPVPTAAEPLESELAPYRAATDTIKFMHAAPVPWPLVERLIAFLAGR